MTAASLTRARHGLIVAGLLSILGAAAAHAGDDPTPANTAPVTRMARPGPDFPNPETFYPPPARRVGQEGSVIVAYCTDATGKLTAPPTIAATSGYELLDAAALQLATAGSGHFLPATQNGAAIGSCGKFKVAFRLQHPPTAPGLGADFPDAGTYYLQEARMAGQQGEVIVHFCVDPTGALSETPAIDTSSGNALLDAGALKLARAGDGHYLPPTDNGVPARGCGRFRVAFKLDDGTDLQLDDARLPTVRIHGQRE